jgi:dihydroorotate dehydrogenase
MMREGVVPTIQYNNPLTITNSFGVPSQSPNFWQNDLKSAVLYKKKGKLIIGSFQGTIRENAQKNDYIKDFVQAAQMVKETGCKVLEVNLSCPNEGTSHLLCFDTETSTRVVQAIKNAIGNTPLIIKLAYFENKNNLKELIKNVGNSIQGVAATNTISTKIVKEDGSQYLPGASGRMWSGVGGKGILWAGLEMVQSLKAIREEADFTYKIFGYGGVSSPEDYQKYKDAGADIVMSVGGSMWNPYLAQEIKEKYL